MYKLVCNVQKYGWGRRGHESKCALYKKASDPEFQINQNDTYAELWMGTHSNCPSKILNNGQEQLLSDYIRSNVSKSLGDKISSHFYKSNEDSILKSGDLPFLFKVLSINQALSIQAHPNQTLARQLNKKDPKNYPDSNHKPEMLVAISEQFHAMCGFRPENEIVEHFNKYTELVELCDKHNCDLFCKEKNEENLRKCFNSLMNKSEEFVSEEFNKLKEKLEGLNEKSELESLFLNLAKQYPKDVGCFSIFLLNCLKLRKGEAIFLSANVPHAYLYGDGVECMACSDNVVRAGLTPKFKDVQVLVDMLDYSMKSSEENKLEYVKLNEYLMEFRPSVDEFSVQEIKISEDCLKKSDGKFVLPKKESGSILIITEANLEDIQFESGEQVKHEARQGLVYYIDANTDVYLKFNKQKMTHQSDSSEILFLAFRAYCDIKQ